MRIGPRQSATLLVAALLTCGLSACGSVNQKLSATMGDYIPQWAGGLPADAPPRPGTAKYDEWMKERERQRSMPASERDRTKPKDNPSQSSETGH